VSAFLANIGAVAGHGVRGVFRVPVVPAPTSVTVAVAMPARPIAARNFFESFTSSRRMEPSGRGKTSDDEEASTASRRKGTQASLLARKLQPQSAKAKKGRSSHVQHRTDHTHRSACRGVWRRRLLLEQTALNGQLGRPVLADVRQRELNGSGQSRALHHPRHEQRLAVGLQLKVR
jgi:hypothetical protein